MSLTYLSTKNAHPRDNDIEFEEGPHIYTIKGSSDYLSVTTWNHSHFEKFDSDKIINNMMRGKNWESSEYYGMTKQQIKKKWSDNGKEASGAGTKMHFDIECFYNGIPKKNDSIEYKYFNEFHAKHMDKKPYRTEWMIYDEELRFAGSIDMVFENDDGTLEIYDWKRCKSITKINSWNKYSTTEEISHLPDTNFWHYSLQLNTYKAILEKNYGKRVTGLYLICLHPSNSNNSYMKIKVPDLNDEIADLFSIRQKVFKSNV
jgi:ATP-dependent exoDNAse (exonuclease V) beta subunit